MKPIFSIPIASKRLTDPAVLDRPVQNENKTKKSVVLVGDIGSKWGEMENATTSGPLPCPSERFVRARRNRYKSHP